MELLQQLSPEQEKKFKQVLQLAETCQVDEAHARQVARLALKIFDELKPLHNLSNKERFWLLSSAFLHDIGLHEGIQAHHKAALRIILNTPMLKWNNKEKLIIGSVARYHRKALPNLKHDHFAALERKERKTVQILAACLRVGDGLDFHHQAVVQELECRITANKIKILCRVDQIPQDEENSAQAKSNLMELVFGRTVKIEWQLPQETQ